MASYGSLSIPLPHLNPGLIRPQELVIHCRKQVTILSQKNFLIAFVRHLKKATFCLINPIFGLKEGTKEYGFKFFCSTYNNRG